MSNSSVTQWQQRLAHSPVAIDGGLATALELDGHDLSGSLWSARLLIDDPGAIARAHSKYVAAGAEVIATCSYQISRSGFERAGYLAADADIAIRDSIQIARDAAGGTDGSHKTLVAASVGPYGATLADGSEYRGDYKLGVSELIDFHRERLLVMAESSPDVLAFETVPSVSELQAINTLLASEFSDLPAWVSVSARDGHAISDGTPIAQAFDSLTAPNVVAIGMNCTKPEYISDLLSALESDHRPKVVYPNAGRTWDAANRVWLDEGVATLPEETLRAWLEHGTRMLGGCCGLGYEHVSAVSALLQTDN